MTVPYTWTIIGGDEETLSVDWPGAIGSYAGWTAAAQVRTAKGVTGTPLADLSVILAAGGAGVMVTATLTAAQTRTLGDLTLTNGAVPFWFDIELRPPAGGPHTVVQGAVVVNLDVTR